MQKEVSKIKSELKNQTEENEIQNQRHKAAIENLKEEMAENIKNETKKLESEVKILSSKLKKSEKEL